MALQEQRYRFDDRPSTIDDWLHNELSTWSIVRGLLEFPIRNVSPALIESCMQSLRIVSSFLSYSWLTTYSNQPSRLNDPLKSRSEKQRMYFVLLGSNIGDYLSAAQRIAVQLPRAHQEKTLKKERSRVQQPTATTPRGNYSIPISQRVTLQRL